MEEKPLYDVSMIVKREPEYAFHGPITKSIFRDHFSQALDVLFRFTRTLITQVLPDLHQLWLYPNCSYDKHYNPEFEVLYPEDTTEEDPKSNPRTFDEAIEFLWRDARVPEWINLTVADVDEKYTYIKMICCGRFTHDSECLYHHREGYPPFHVLGPPLPPDYVKGEKYDLHWQTKSTI